MNTVVSDRGDRRHDQSGARKPRRQSVGDHAPDERAEAADQHDDAGLEARLSGARP